MKSVVASAAEIDLSRRSPPFLWHSFDNYRRALMMSRWQEHSGRDGETPRGELYDLDSVQPSERQQSPVDPPNGNCIVTNHGDSTVTQDENHAASTSTTAENQRSSSREGSEVQDSKEIEARRDERKAAAFLAREKAARQAAEEEMAGEASPESSSLEVRDWLETVHPGWGDRFVVAFYKMEVATAQDVAAMDCEAHAELLQQLLAAGARSKHCKEIMEAIEALSEDEGGGGAW